MRSLSALETAAVASVAGCILAAGAPAFVRNLHASRLAEPMDGLNHIATRATFLAAGQPPESAYPESVELTPSQVPQGERVVDPPGTWDHNTWRVLGFEWTVPHSYSFRFVSDRKPGYSSFTAFAHGDLDGDGVLSTFSISGESKDGAEPITFVMEMTREVE